MKAVTAAAQRPHWTPRIDVSAVSAGREMAAAVFFALLIIGLTCIPYLLGYSLATPGTIFTGVLMNPEDSNSYLAKMDQGLNGSWLYEIPFTSEPHQPAFVGGFYLLLGQVSRHVGLVVTQMWNIARLVFGLALFLLVFAFCNSFLKDATTRWLAYVVALTGSGLGWLLLLAGQNYWLGDMPVDFKMPEAHLFFSAMTFPHFAAGTICIIGSMWLSKRASQSGMWRHSVFAGALNLALAIIYPFLIYLVAGILVVHWLVESWESRRPDVRLAKQAAVALAIPSPLLIYYAITLRTNPVFAAWDAQAATPSPNALHYLIAFGTLIVLAAPVWKKPELKWLWAWVLAAALLVYAPLNPQRRFVEGVQVPLAILAACGFTNYYLPRMRSTSWFRMLSRRPGNSAAGIERLVIVGLVAALALSNIYVLSSSSITAALQQPFPFFRTKVEIQSMEWMSANVTPGSIVLAAYETGNFIPTRTSEKSVIGHWAETMNFESKSNAVRTFFDAATSDDWRAKLIADQRVDYVYFGPAERALGNYNPAAAGFLKRVYQSENVTVFRVVE